jgi:hypothetical protein
VHHSSGPVRIYRAGPDKSVEDGGSGGGRDGGNGSGDIEDADTNIINIIKPARVLYETLAYLQFIHDHMLYV